MSVLPSFDPVIPASRLYMYFYHDQMPPWGISWDFVRNTPHMLLIADIQVDRYAIDAEENSRKRLGWVSGEIHRILRKKGILKPYDFEKVLRPIAVDNMQLRSEVRRRIDAAGAAAQYQTDLSPLFKELNEVDHELLPTVMGEQRTEFDFLLGNESSPAWMSDADEALKLFLNPDFRLLPRISDLPKDKQEAMRTYSAGVAEIQRVPMIKLATGVYDYKEYQDELVRLGERKNYDYLMDAIMTNYEDTKFHGLTWEDKLGRLLDVRKKHRDTFMEIIRDKSMNVNQRLQWLREQIRTGEDRFFYAEDEIRSRIEAGGVIALVGYSLSYLTRGRYADLAAAAGSFGLAFSVSEYLKKRLSSLRSKDLQLRVGAARAEIVRKLGP